MSEKEKKILEQLTQTVPKLEPEKQQYILGVAEGMAIMREDKMEKEEQ